jgi:hypothetical protein
MWRWRCVRKWCPSGPTLRDSDGTHPLPSSTIERFSLSLLSLPFSFLLLLFSLRFFFVMESFSITCLRNCLRSGRRSVRTLHLGSLFLHDQRLSLIFKCSVFFSFSSHSFGVFFLNLFRFSFPAHLLFDLSLILHILWSPRSHITFATI